MKELLLHVVRACSHHAMELEERGERHAYSHAINTLLRQAEEIDRLTSQNERLKAELKKDRPA